MNETISRLNRTPEGMNAFGHRANPTQPTVTEVTDNPTPPETCSIERCN